MFSLGAALHAWAVPQEPVDLTVAWGLPSEGAVDVVNRARLAMMDQFQDRYPWIAPVPSTNLRMVNETWTRNIVPLMQIAGEVSPDVLYVNFRQSHSYITSRFLYPLDRYVEEMAGIPGGIPGGAWMDLDAYLEALSKGPAYEERLQGRVPAQCWPVMRRACPLGSDCPYTEGPRPVGRRTHYHIWCFPVGPVVTALFYRRDLFREAGLPNRPPETFDELMQMARQLTNPPEGRYGLHLGLTELGYSTMPILYSFGGRIVQQDVDGHWRCVFDSDEAVEAFHFVARLFHEPFENPHGRFNGVVTTEGAAMQRGGYIDWAMEFAYFSTQGLIPRPELLGAAPIPRGPDGNRGGEFNCQMLGIYAGVEEKRVRDAAWRYIAFYDGHAARETQTRVFVQSGLSHLVPPPALRNAGLDTYITPAAEQWEEAYQQALATGIPEPYGKNCQQVYSYVSKAVDQIRNDPTVVEAIQTFDAAAAKERIREILEARVRMGNAKMLGILPPETRRFRHAIAWAVVCGILMVFVSVGVFLQRIFRAPPEAPGQTASSWRQARYARAYLFTAPALLLLLLWAYWPLARGAYMAFLDYNVRGFSSWTGIENFANVLFDSEFWFSLWISLKYTLFFIFFGFWTPIALAFLLSEVPRGSVFFRVIYYLPAVLSGAIVVFLWHGFYGPYGLINELLNLFVAASNALLGTSYEQFRTSWLTSPQYALLLCLLPIIWNGVGPGCLIYLAALKTVPEELYEAADIDGAGVLGKIRHISLPSIKVLVAINFIGVVVGVIKSGGENILAMTGGGPYTPYGQTEVIGLHIFWEAFGFLRFGTALAMAWILGSMLVGFTVIQLRRLSNVEFRTATRA